MNNKLLLKQARKGFQKLIDRDSEIITIYRKPLADDGFGGKVEDPNGTPIPYEIKCKISKERKTTNKYEPASGGMSTNLSRFIQVNHKTIIFENDTFESNRIDKSFKIGIVDPLEEYQGIIGYQAPLIEAVK